MATKIVWKVANDTHIHRRSEGRNIKLPSMPKKYWRDYYAKHKKQIRTNQQKYEQSPKGKARRAAWNEEHEEDTKEYQKIYWFNNKELLSIANKKYKKTHVQQLYEVYLLNREAILAKTALWRLQNKVSTAQYDQAYRCANPEKYLAHIIARQVPLGDACELCDGTENLEKHHPDYAYPLIIVTLCRSCHNFIKDQEQTEEALAEEII